MQLVAHGDHSRGNIHNHFWNKVGVKPWRTIARVKLLQLLFEGADPPVTRSPDHADVVAFAFLHGGKIKTGVLYGLLAGSQGVLRKKIVFLEFLLVNITFRVKALHFAGKAGFE